MMKRLLAATLALSAFCIPAATKADTGPRSDTAAIRKIATVSNSKCPQRVSHVSADGDYALATVEQRGACDAAAVWIFGRKAGKWKTLGGIGGVPDACSIHAKGVPSAIAPRLIRAFTGSSDASLTSMKNCGG